MTAPAGSAARAGLAFATPANWFPVQLPRDQAGIGALADDAVAANPELAGQRDALAALLGGLTTTLTALNVIGAYVTVLDVAGGPLPATLLVSVRDMDGSTLDQIGREMSAGHDITGPPVVDALDLPIGPVIRVERMRDWPGTVDGTRPVSFVVHYVAQVPGLPQAVLMTFSTPAVALASQLRPLFHQMACTLRMDEPEASP